MLYFLVRVAVYMLALFLTLTLLPGFHADFFNFDPLAGISAADQAQATPEDLAQLEAMRPWLATVLPLLTLFVMALAFWFWNWLLWPAVLLLAGRLVLWSFGLLLILVNALLFYVAVVGSDSPHVDQPVFLWCILGGLSMALWLVFLEGLTGLDSPLKTRTQSRRRYWRFLRWLSLGGRNYFAENLRIAQSLDIITMYLKDIAFDNSPFGPIRRFFQRGIYWFKEPLIDESAPETVRYMLQELGPTYIKLAQIVSSRADHLPPEWREQMSKLHSNVAPLPIDTAREIIRRELGAPIFQLYATLNENPLTTDLTAQVHRATLPDSQEVVVKVQRPDIDVTVRADLNVVRDLARYLGNRFGWARNSNIRAITNECADHILRELDYTNVAVNGRILAKNMHVFPKVHVPAVYPDLSTSRIMTQEFVPGVRITDAAALDAAGADRTLLAAIFMRAIVKQILYDGFFYGDPHHSNVLVDTAAARIIFPDLSMIGTLTSAQRTALADLLWSLSKGERREIAKTVLGLAASHKEVDEERFIADVDRLFTRHTAFFDSGVFISGAMKALLDAMYSTGLRVDPQFTLAIKAMVQAEETVRTLDPAVSFADATFTAVKELVEEKIRLDVVAPQSAAVNESFDLATAVVQPGAPPLTMDDLPVAGSEENTIYRPNAEEVIRYRIGVTGADCAVSPPDYVILLHPGENSRPRFFQITPHKPGSCTLVVNAYQEDNVLAAQTRIHIQVQAPVRTLPEAPSQRMGESATTDLVLTPSEIKHFKDALLSAFQRPTLEQIVFFGLGVRLDDIVARNNYDKEVTDLAIWANDNHKVADLLQEAREENSGNVALREFATYLQASGHAPPGAQ